MKKYILILVLFCFCISGYSDYVVGTNGFTCSDSGNYRAECTINSATVLAGRESWAVYIYIQKNGVSNYTSPARGSVDFPISYTQPFSAVSGDVFSIATSIDFGQSWIYSVDYTVNFVRIVDGNEGDEDGDGIPDINDPDHPDYDPYHPNSDFDGDGTTNFNDSDDDDDGIFDDEDPEPYVPDDAGDGGGDDDDDSDGFDLKELESWPIIVAKLSPSVDGSFASTSRSINLPVNFKGQHFDVGIDFNNIPHGLSSGIGDLKSWVQILSKIIFCWLFLLSMYKFLNK